MGHNESIERLWALSDEQLILTDSDKKHVKQEQILSLFLMLVRSLIYIGVIGVWFFIFIELITLNIAPILVVLTFSSIVFAEFRGMIDLLKHPAQSECGYVWKMGELGWQPILRETLGHAVCVGFRQEEDTIVWNAELYFQMNR